MDHEPLSYPALSGRAWYLPEGWPREQALPPGFRRGDFLVGSEQCGRGAPSGCARALRAAGVAAVIAPSVDRVFLREALEAGLPAVAVEEAAAIKSGDRLRVDIETLRIANRASGDRYIIKNLDDAALERLRGMGSAS
jgi:3-isopropylmalate/(R)-2-methylmalate dehydratase small subunit